MRIPTSEAGVTLAADLYLPQDAGRSPVLVTAMPYRKDVSAEYDASLHWFARRGYAGLLVELRGFGASDGVPRPRTDPGEGDDVVAAIEWAAAQPWSSGAVGMWGISAGGVTTMRAASRHPDALKAIIPMMAPLDSQRYHGARGDLGLMAQWAGPMLVQQMLPPLIDHTSVIEQRRWQHRLHDVEPIFLDLARRGPGHPVWRDRVVDAASITTPALCVGGWRDLHAEGITGAFELMRGPKKLLLGPWMHSLPQDSPFCPIDFLSIAWRWWEHWLRGVDTGVMHEPPICLYVLGANAGWRTYPSWPPGKDELTLRTGADTTLTEEARDPGGGTIAIYDPDPTIGTASGLGGEVAATGVPLDQHDDDTRAVTATSAPLSNNLIITGHPDVTIRLADSHPPQNVVHRLVARLCDVDSDGSSTLISVGVLTPTTSSDTYRVVLKPTTYRIPTGHRLRVAVSDADFPRLTPLPEPRTVHIASIELCATTVPDDAGEDTELPDVEHTHTPPPERWTITRDVVHDGADVLIGRDAPPTPTSDGHLVETHNAVRATVRRAAPAGATVIGTYSTRVQLATGGDITATARVRCTQTHVWVRGELTIDGLSTFSKVWEAPVDHAHQRDEHSGIFTGVPLGRDGAS